MDTHLFRAARPGGKICNEHCIDIILGDGPCGRLASHPVHETLEQHAARGSRRSGRGYQGKIESLTARMAAALVQLRHLRAEVSVVAVVPGHDDRSRFRENIDKITKTLTLPEPAVTPAEARTGISDRAAAALADVAELRRGLRTHGTGNVHTTAAELAALNRIEQALRADGTA